MTESFPAISEAEKDKLAWLRLSTYKTSKYWRISARAASAYRDIHTRRKYFLINVSPREGSSSGETLNWKQFQVREFPGILEPEWAEI